MKDKAMILRHLGAIAEVVMFNKLVVFDCQTLVQIIIISIKASVQSSNQHGKDKYMTDNPEGYTKSADKATKWLSMVPLYKYQSCLHIVSEGVRDIHGMHVIFQNSVCIYIS